MGMKLAEYLETPEGKSVSQAEWGRRCGLSRGYISQLRDGEKTPSIVAAYHIQVATGGAVSMEDWVPDYVVKEVCASGGLDDHGLRREVPEEV